MRMCLKRLLPSLRLAAAALLLAALLGFAALAASTGATSNTIDSVAITRDLAKLEIKASFTDEFVAENSGGELCLFELLPYQSTLRINELQPIATCAPAPSVTLSIDFAQGTQSRLFAKYVLAVKRGDSYSCVTNAYFIDNPEVLAQSTFAFPATSSKKGLIVQQLSDAQELGAGHTVVTVAINEYLAESSSSETLSYIFDNKTYYIDRVKLELLDHRIKVMSDAGVNVYINLVLTPPDENTPSRLRSLYFDSYSPSASLCAVNTQNQDSVLFLESFVTFVAERYTREDRQYGFAGSFIFGYEVNNNRRYNSMGAASLDSYLNSYVTAFRIVSSAVRSVYSNGRVYISIANNWTSEVSDKTAAADSSLEYAASALLESFNSKLKYSGNIPWGVAVNPYPSDHSLVKFWEDADATSSADTPYLTMSNIGVLGELLAGGDYLYGGARRSVVVSDFALTSGANSDEEQKLQAAAWALAYLKAMSDDGIEAFIYHRQVDHAGENGLNYGIWTRLDGTTVTPQSKKTIYNVFKYIDTAAFADYESGLLQTLGADSWSALVSGVKAPAVTRKVIETIPVPAADIPDQYNERVIASFSKGELYGFYPSDNAEYLELRTDSADEAGADESKLYAKMYNVGRGEYMGVENIFTTPLSLENGGYMTLRLKAVFPAEITSATVMLRLLKRDMSVLYEGVATVAPGEWDTLTFKLDGLADVGAIDAMKVWIRPVGDVATDGEIGLWLDSVSVYDKVSIAWWQIALWVVLILVIALVVLGGIVILYSMARVRRAKLERARREAARRRARLASGQAPPQRRIPPSSQRPHGNEQGRQAGEAPRSRNVQRPQAPDDASRRARRTPPPSHRDGE